ncbi:hypothetical protein GCM10027605_27760 [Micromonospora zhanjiangensis]
MLTVPAVGRSRPAAQCNRVDLPEPDGPITAVNVPAAKSTLTSSSAVTGPALVWYTLDTDRSATETVVVMPDTVAGTGRPAHRTGAGTCRPDPGRTRRRSVPAHRTGG